MRNWNFHSHRKCRYIGTWIYLTYEELKRGSSRYSFHKPRRIYLTYEELKLLRTCVLPWFRYWIYLTYEELKLYKASPAFCPGNRDLSYLWGIETNTSPGSTFDGHIGFILPMRNWNTDKEAAEILKYQGFILPMRNWNYDEMAKDSVVGSADLSYLWGIETITNELYNTFKKQDLSYLWGIETEMFHTTPSKAR